MKYLYAFLLLVGLVSCSKEDSAKAEYKEQYVKIAETIAAQIPSNSRVSLKLTSPDKNGLPEAFLLKLMAEFSGALVQSGKSRFQILNRNSTEEIWQEAVEFNNQDVEKITKSAGADVSVTLSPKINEKGIDLSVTAYSLKEENMGIVLASASELIPMNVKTELGVNVKNLNQQVEQLTKLLDKDGAVKGNELVMLFNNFGSDLNEIARTYPSGCSKPVYNEGTDKIAPNWKMQCEVYSDGKLLQSEGIDFNKSIDIVMFSGDRRGSVSDIDVSWSDASGDAFELPASVKNFTSLLACTENRHDEVYKVSLPNKEPYFLGYSSSSGSAGIWITLSLFLDYHKLPKIGDSNFNLKFCSA
jgi:hypothetical protein